MKTYVFHIDYLSGFDMGSVRVVIRGAENLKDAFSKALAEAPDTIRTISLFDVVKQ